MDGQTNAILEGVLLMLMNQFDRPIQPASTIIETTQATAKRIVHGWVLTLLALFVALRLTAYISLYGCFGLLILLVPGFALYKSWRPWVRYIFTGK